MPPEESLCSTSPLQTIVSVELMVSSAKVLTEQLRKLEGEEIIYRDYKPTIPPQVTYGLANKGKDLAQVLSLIDKVAQKWQKVFT